MEQLIAPPLPAAYYRHHAARVRQMARQALTAGIREHLDDVALQYDHLAERVESTPRAGRGGN
jgi:DNA-binding TFAR19-related protein (PDSD5 family)